MLIGFFDKGWPANHSFVDDFFIGRASQLDSRVVVVCERSDATRVFKKSNVIVLACLHRRRRLGRFLNFFIVGALLYRFKNNNSKINVLVRNCPVMLGGAVLFKFIGYGLVYQNSFPHELMLSSLKRFILVCYFKLVQFWVDAILGVSPVALIRLRMIFRKVEVFDYVPLCVSRNLKPSEAEPAKRELGDLKLCYVGTLSESRRFDVVIKGFYRAVQEGVIAELHVFGGTDLEISIYQKLTVDLNIQEQVVFHGVFPRCQLLSNIGQFDFGLSLFPVNALYREASPTKLVEYMSVGLPVLASKGCDLQESIVAKAQCGELVDFNIEGVRDGIVCISKYSSQRRKEAVRSGYSYVDSHLVYEKYVSKFIGLWAPRSGNR